MSIQNIKNIEKNIARAGMVGAIYVALTIVFAPISYGPVQFRISEVLCLLPFFWKDSIWGLFIGCLISNLFGGFGVVDVIFGSSATLIAAYLSYRAKNLTWAAAAPVAVNGLIVGGYLSVLTGMKWYLSVPYVAVGEAVVCFGLGIPLFKWLKKIKFFVM